MPPEWIPWAIQGGFLGTLIWGIRLIYLGKLVPASTLLQCREDVKEWRAAYFAEVEVNKELVKQLAPFMSTAREIAA